MKNIKIIKLGETFILINSKDFKKAKELIEKIKNEDYYCSYEDILSELSANDIEIKHCECYDYCINI